jgi:hypothetical protein
MQQFVDRMDEFLEALLSREAMPEHAGACHLCHESIAVWRCRECISPTLICRSCMRSSHRENPFHRIECWNGSYFRRAELSEVGVYLFIRHYTGVAVCDTLARWSNLLDSAAGTKDREEQIELRRSLNAVAPYHMPDPDPVPYTEDFDMDNPIDDFDDFENEGEDLGDGDEKLEENAFANADPALAAATVGTLHRVVHTNGLHNIAMVSCECHGTDNLPLDLFAAQLLPASLKRIKTLFSAQVLDHFRLCNLELKASAYQFYQLIRRLTTPMAPGEVLDLYREFRRMARIWRWMKKLKWAGYAGGPNKVKDVGAGELAIFCPAYPQPGINIPDNWREDHARHVEDFYLYLF